MTAWWTSWGDSWGDSWGALSVTHDTSGDLVGAGAVVSGAAERTTPGGEHIASGALVGPGSVLSGTALHGAQITQGARWLKPPPRRAITIHETSGRLIGRGAIIAGSARHSFEDRNALELLLIST